MNNTVEKQASPQFHEMEYSEVFEIIARAGDSPAPFAEALENFPPAKFENLWDALAKLASAIASIKRMENHNPKREDRPLGAFEKGSNSIKLAEALGEFSHAPLPAIVILHLKKFSSGEIVALRRASVHLSVALLEKQEMAQG